MFRLLLIILVLLLILYLLNSKSIENFSNEGENQDIYFGILPRENHRIRLRNVLYYNDPIFLQYNDKFLILRDQDCLGDLNEALKTITFVKSKKYRQGLSPIEYNQEVLLETTPKLNSIISKKELIIVPHIRPINNQQPYLEMNDFINIKNSENEYLTVRPFSNTLEFVAAKDIPTNAIFKITSSPQCYVNYKKYGLDNRNTEITSLKLLNNEIKDKLDNEKNKLNSEEEELNKLRKEELDLRERIIKLENSLETDNLETDKAKMDYENKILEIKETIENKKIEMKRDIENKKQLAESIFDEKYIQELRNIVNNGKC